ncbi:ABC transporter ATP-binding protein [bacterium]|nr:ABC transporter ATP-binding protein [candidate division CSSED10-310 bacterium]
MKPMHHGADTPDNFKMDRKLVFRVVSYLRPYWGRVIAAVVCLILFSALQLTGPYLIKLAIDGPIAQKDLHGLLLLTLAYVGTIAAAFIVMFAQIYLMTWTGQQIMNDIRVSLFAHIQRLNLAYFDSHPAGWIITRLTSDIETLNELLSSGIVQFIGDIITLAGILIIMFTLDTRLAFFVLISMSLFAGNVILFRKWFRDSFRDVRTQVARLMAFLAETIRGIHVVQLFNNQQLVQNHFDQTNRDTLNAHLKTVFYFALFVPTVDITSALTIVLILAVGGSMTENGIISVGVLVAFFQYAHRFFQPIRDLSQKFNILQSAMASSERIFQMLDSKEIIPEPLQPVLVSAETLRGDIEFDHVWFAYTNDNWVLRDVSFRIQTGESIAVVGATGAGKTTIANLLCRFYDPQRGVIKLDGIDIRLLPVRVLRSAIGLIHQDAVIFSGSVADNVRVGRPEMTDSIIESLAASIGLNPFVQRLADGLRTDVGEAGGRLSAGQKQLVAFLRSVSFQPSVMILDEATSNVDSFTETAIQTATVAITRNRTSIIVAHRLSTIRHVDRIMVFHKGRLAELGTHDELIGRENGLYPKIYQLYYSGQA